MNRRAKRVALWAGGALLVPLLLLAALIWWARSEGSLQRALALVQRWLPQEQQLVATGVSGALLRGGHVDRLQWSQPGLTVTIEGIALEWTPGRLLGGELAIQTLSLAKVRVQSSPQPDSPDEPFVMPANLSLPIRITAPLSIARLEYQAHVLQHIAAGYRYDGVQHSLRLTELQYGQSRAEASLQLNGETLAVAAGLNATLKDIVPEAPQTMQVKMTARGGLAGGDAAAVDVTLDAREAQAAADAATPDAAQVAARATLHPWRDQPVHQVDLQLHRLDLHTFHARAPVTSLRGRGSLTPLSGGTAWHGLVDIANELPDAWDKGRLPLRQLRAEADLSPEQLRLAGARVELGGRTPAGVVNLQGRMPIPQAQQATLQFDLQAVDLRQLLTTLPRTSLEGPVSITPAPRGRNVTGKIDNRASGPLDAHRMPVDRLVAELSQRDAGWHIAAFDLQVGDGHALLQGDYSPGDGALDLRAELRALPLRQMHRKFAADGLPRLTGSIAAKGSLQREISFDASLGSSRTARSTPARSPWEISAVEARGSWSASRLRMERVHLDAFQARVDGSGIDIALPGLESLAARLQGAAPGLALTADATMSPQTGGGRIDLQLASADALANWLRGLPWMGARIPAFRARGAARFAADWQGNWQQWLAGIQSQAQSRLHMNATAHSAGLDFEMPSTATRPAQRLNLRKLDLNAQGNPMSATVDIRTEAQVNDARAQLDARMTAARAPGRGAPRWNVAVDRFAAAATLPGNAGPWSLQLSDDLRLSAQLGADIELTATAGTATVLAPPTLGNGEPLQVKWQPLVWRRTSQGAMTLQSSGAVSGLQPAWLDVLLAHDGEGPLAAAGLRTDLVLRGDWNVQLAERVALRARLQRERGDLRQVDADAPAGIRTLDLTVEARDENVNAALDLDTEHAGSITARVATRLRQQTGGWSLPPQAPLSGEIRAALPDLSSWAFLVPPGWRIQGEMKSAMQISGTVRMPQLRGSIEGDNLNIRSVLDGVDLHNGRLRAALHDSRMDIGTLEFEGGTGSRAHVRGFSGNRTPAPTARGRMTAQGYIDWSRIDDPANTDAETARSHIAMKLDAKLERMQVLVRHDRQMTLSGTLGAALDAGTLQVRGDLVVDRAAIVLPEASAPTLGDDVLIRRDKVLRNPGAVEALQARGELKTRKPMDMQVKLDLGHDLALEGQGITTRLEGDLTVRSATTGNDPFRVFGEVRTVEGRYRAWGQALDVETGVVRFNGPYGNPSLDLLAIRPKIEVRAGVRVTGTLLAPRVQLFSDPELPEGEKLSWVVLGRATVINGAEGSSMQQAALGLAAGQLGGRLASGLGLDELGLSEAGVSIGKRISNELYLTYQQGLAGAASTLFIFYDITRKLTLRASASEASAVDLVYTIKFD